MSTKTLTVAAFVIQSGLDGESIWTASEFSLAARFLAALEIRAGSRFAVGAAAESEVIRLVEPFAQKLYEFISK